LPWKDFKPFIVLDDDDDDIAMPEGPPPTQDNGDEEDSDDDIPMPEGPPPGASVNGVPVISKIILPLPDH
jgi:hypothetical protein